MLYEVITGIGAFRRSALGLAEFQVVVHRIAEGLAKLGDRPALEGDDVPQA